MPHGHPFLVALLATAPIAAGVAQVPLRLGQTVAGRLSPTDQQFSDGSRYKVYVFAGDAGDTITVDLTSDDFDANVVLTDAAGNRLRSNDDGGENCNARLTHVLPAAANYRLYANSSAPAEVGGYRLSVVRGRSPAPADTTCRGFGSVAGLVHVGQSVSGSLAAEDDEFTDSTYYKRYVLPVEANQTFTVDLRSEDFDAFLLLERGRAERLVQNDDGGGDCHARIVYTATDDRPLRVVVNTANQPPRQTGRYTLRVSEGATATDAKGNCRSAARTAGAPPPAPAAQAPSPAGAAARAVAVGQSALGELTRDDHLRGSDSTYAQTWTLEGRAGQTVTVDLESDAFDAFLFVTGPGLERTLQDDDSGGNCNARVTVNFPETGAYAIVVNTADRYATGRFSLSVISGSKPASLSRCSRTR